jgi:hypothetical protein
LHYSVGPSAFLCVLTQEPCRDPVVARNGHTYSRFAITRWMEVSTGNQHSWRCPLSNNLLTDFTLVPNYMIKGFCDDYWLLADAVLATQMVLRTLPAQAFRRIFEMAGLIAPPREIDTPAAMATRAAILRSTDPARLLRERQRHLSNGHLSNGAMLLAEIRAFDITDLLPGK